MRKGVKVTIESVDNGFIVTVEEEKVLPIKHTYVYKSFVELVDSLRLFFDVSR